MAATMPGLRGDALRDFSGGPNLRDSPPELAANEVLGSRNITYDERGGAQSRLGHVKQNPDVFPGGPVVAQAWSKIIDQRITQAGADLYLGDVTVSTHTFTTADPCDFCETKDRIVAAHPVDGIHLSPDGVTWTKVADTAAPGEPLCCAAWQNKVWVGLADGTVQWCAEGDPTVWDSTTDPTAGSNEIWENDQEAVVALYVGSGQDIQGRPGLVAFKQESCYRINDPATGAYTTISSSIGAAGKNAVVGVGSKVCWVGKHGVFWWREGLVEPVDASDRLAPLWQDSQLNYGQMGVWAAGRKRNRAVFSLTRDGSTVNDLALELHPEMGWIAPHLNAMRCYATSAGSSETLYGGSTSVDGQVYKLESGGTDDGSPIVWRIQTRWVELNGGFQAQVFQIRVHGRGSGTMTVRLDYASAGGTDYPLDLTQDLLMWDTGLAWDSGVRWQVPAFQQTETFDSVGACRQFSLIFTGSSTGTSNAPQVLGASSSPEVGAFGLTAIEYLFVPLGLS